MPYKAFISYSHAADGQLAPTLQSALHRFAKPFYRLRALRVFRDKTSLHLTPELWPLIQKALAESEYFLLLASPDAAKSHWVEAEVEEWLSLKGGSLDNFLIVLTGGEIVWDGSTGDFDWEQTTALPAALRGKFKREPLYSDLRWASKATDLSLRNPQFLDEVGSLGATLHGRPKDDMIGQDVRQHRLFKFAAGVVALLLVALTTGASAAAYYANQQRNVAVAQTAEARRQKIEADDQRQRAVEAARKESDARATAEQRRVEAEDATKREKLAKDNETTQRHKAEQATENEKTARLQAEERRKEAERQSRIALSREVASNAKSQLGVNTELGALLAVEAVKVSRTEQSEDALRQAALESRLKAVMHVYEGTEPASDLLYNNNHESYVYEAAFSPDGKYVVTASHDALPRVWEAQTGKLVAEMKGNEDAIAHAEFSPDARLVLTVGNSGARLWDAKTGKAVRVLRHVENSGGEEKDYVADATFSPDGRYVLTAGNDDTARVWETDTGRSVSVMRGHEAALRNAVFSPDGKYVATASDDKTARVWEALTGKPVSVLSGHRDNVLRVAFSPDGKLVATASVDKTARVWEAGTGRPVAQLRGHMGIVFGAVFSPRGDYVLTAGEDGTARVWEAGTGNVIAELRGHTAAVSKAAFSYDGKYIVTAGGDGTARVWEASFPVKGEEEEAVDTDSLTATVRQVRWRSLGVLRGHSGPLLSAAFSPDGEYITTASIDGTARVWEASFPQNLEQLHGPANKVRRMVFSPDGKYLATDDRDDYVRVWEVHTGRNVALLRDNDEEEDSAAFSPGGRFLKTSTGDASYVRETGTWKIVHRLEGSSVEGFSSDDKYALVSGNVFETDTWQKVFDVPEKDAHFIPGGQFIAATSGEGKTRVREVGTWRVAAEVSAAPSSFSPDGELFLTRASADDPTEQVWETRTGRKLSELPEGGDVWSPDGKLVVSMKEGLEVRVWEARTGRRVAELGEYANVKESERDKHVVNSVAFSPDSKLLVTTSNDTTARVWEVATGKEVSVFRDHRKEVKSAAFSPDGRLVVTVGDDARIRVWEAATGLSVTEYHGDNDSTITPAFSPDGRLIVLDLEGDEAQVYACEMCYSLEDILGIARAHVTRELTAGEREKYLHQAQLK